MKHIFVPALSLSLLFAGCEPDPNPVAEIPSFEHVYDMTGGQVIRALVADEDGVLMFGSAGASSSGGQLQGKLLLLRTDLNGNLTWHKTIETGGVAEGRGMARTSDGGLILIGSQNSAGTLNVLLVRTDHVGNVVWQREFGGMSSDGGQAVIELEQGGFLLTGTSFSFGAGNGDMYVIRTDDNGEVLWEKTFGRESLDGGTALIQLDQFHIMALGFTESFGAGYRDQWLLSISVEGDSLWGATFGGTGYEESQGIVRTSDGGYLLCGHSASADPVHALHAIRLLPDGTILWQQHLGVNGVHDGGDAVAQMPDGTFLCAGTSDSPGPDEDVYMVRLDADGNILSEERFGGEGEQWVKSVIHHRGSFFLAGSSVVDGNSNALLIKRPG